MQSIREKDEYSERDNPFHMLVAREMWRRLDISMMQLRLRTRAVIIWYFGLIGPRKTMKEIARELGISSGRVQQILHKGLRELQTSRYLRMYEDSPDSTFEALGFVDVPQVTLFTKRVNGERQNVLPERITGIEDHFRINTKILIASSEL